MLVSKSLTLKDIHHQYFFDSYVMILSKIMQQATFSINSIDTVTMKVSELNYEEIGLYYLRVENGS